VLLNLRIVVLEEGVKRLAKSIYNETNIPELLVVEDITAIKDERRLDHGVIHLLVVVFLELIPFSENAKSMGTTSSLQSAGSDSNGVHVLSRARLDTRVIPLELGSGQINTDLVLIDLRVVDAEVGTIVHETLADINSRGFTGITSILLESESIDTNLLVFDGVEASRDDTLDKAFLLVVVHGDNRLPVLGDSVETDALADVDQVEDILLEARSTKANRGV
jgi:hypothetical protein